MDATVMKFECPAAGHKVCEGQAHSQDAVREREKHKIPAPGLERSMGGRLNAQPQDTMSAEAQAHPHDAVREGQKDLNCGDILKYPM